jgi:type IV secretory pathway TrbF-like protein
MRTDHPGTGFQERMAILRQVANAGRKWCKAFWWACGLNMVLAVGVILMAYRPAWMPYIVELNNATGEVRVVGPIPPTFSVSHLTIHTFVRRFVEDIRSIPSDKEVVKANWRRARNQVTPEGAQVLMRQEADWQPLLTQEPVTVKIVRISARDENRYDVWWQETRYSVRHEWAGMTSYRGLFTVKWMPPMTEDQRQDAPLGMFFHLWTIEEGL